MPDDEGTRGQANQDRDIPLGLILVGILGVILVLFIVSNNHQSEINFLWLDTSMPMWTVILIAGALGAAIGWSVSAIRRRSKRKNQ